MIMMIIGIGGCTALLITGYGIQDSISNVVDYQYSEITRYDVPSLNGFNFVMKHALGGGATMSLRLDSLGKSMGSAVMRMKIHVEDGEL